MAENIFDFVWQKVGLSMKKRGLPFWIAPPLCIAKEQIDQLLDAVDKTLTDWEEKMRVSV